MSESVQHLRVYTSARALEDQIYEYIKTLPEDQHYELGNNLRRASAAVSYHLMEVHHLFSYRLKLDALARARYQAEATQKHLQAALVYGASPALIAEYTAVIKQTWGLTKWLKIKIQERQERAIVTAKEELAAARA